jgi:DNA polymerase III delta prime subunit
MKSTIDDPGKGKRLLSFIKNTPERYTIYQPYTIRILLEQGNENSFSIDEKKITDKLNSLLFHDKLSPSEFRSNLLSLTKTKKYTWYADLVIFDDTNDPPTWKLNSEEFDESHIEEILKECNKEIAKFHVKILTKKNLTPEVYFVIAGDGAGGTWYDEFVTNIQDTNSSLDWETAGVDYREHANFDLTSKSDDEIEKLPNSIELTTIKNIKKGSIVVINKKDTDGVVNTGIVTKEYYFEKDATSYIHRIGVKYLNISMPEINYQNNEYKTGIYHSPQYQKDVLKNLFDEEIEPKNYFIITSYPDSKYRDKPGKEYEFPFHIKNAKLFVNGTNFIVQTKINDQNHFVGYGKVQEIIKKQITNDKGKSITMCTANYSQYHEFDTPKIRTSEIKDKMQWIAFPNTGNGSPPPAMLEIPHSFYREIMGEDLTSKEDELDAVSMDNYDRALDWKPNLILYGPPGTGKTYHANEIAKRITRNQISKIGICWPTDKDEDKIEDFQNVIEDNEKVLWGVNWSIDQVKKSDFPIKGYIYYKQNIIAIATISNCTLHEETNDADLKLRPEKWHNGQDYKNYLHFTLVNRCVPFSHKKLKLNDSTKIIPDIIQQRVYVKQKTNFIRKVTFHPSYSYEDFVEGYRPNVKGTDKNPYKLENGIFKQICNDAKDDDPKTKYVIIIDEINRGNIPKILGELITLIEKDKRNLENSLKLTYSKDDFFVPENLIIIGTMNTADKSLMQMDDALKRRFVFEELMPDTKLLEEELTKNKISNSKDYSKILKRINEKITGDGKKDEAMIQFRDRQIGHSYFWKLQNDDDLQKVIKYDIIPLLQDYFYGDYSKIREILGNKKDDEFTIIGKDNRTTDLVNDISQSHELRQKLLKILE